MSTGVLWWSVLLPLVFNIRGKVWLASLKSHFPLQLFKITQRQQMRRRQTDEGGGESEKAVWMFGLCMWETWGGQTPSLRDCVYVNKVKEQGEPVFPLKICLFFLYVLRTLVPVIVFLCSNKADGSTSHSEMAIQPNPGWIHLCWQKRLLPLATTLC